jgi:hypothetical protein
MGKSSCMEERDTSVLDNRGWLPVDIRSVPYVQGKPKLRRVLLVDDDKGVRKAMAGLHGDLGYNVLRDPDHHTHEGSCGGT